MFALPLFQFNPKIVLNLFVLIMQCSNCINLLCNDLHNIIVTAFVCMCEVLGAVIKFLLLKLLDTALHSHL